MRNVRYIALCLAAWALVIGPVCCALNAAHAATANMNLTLPTVGVTVGPTWATYINTAITAIDAHDHSTGYGVQIGTAGINIAATFEVNSNHISEIKSLRMDNNASPLATGSDLRSLYVSGGNLYYNNASGTQIQLTSGSGLNVASVGAFGGDYVSAAASAIYTSASTLYTFRQPDTSDAHIRAGNGTLTGTLTVTGASTLTGGITTPAAASLNGSASMANSAPSLTFSDTTATADDFYLNADGNHFNILYDVGDDGAFEGTALSYDSANARLGVNDATPDYGLDVNGTARVTGAVTLDSTLSVGGNASLSGTLGVTGAVTLSNSLSVASSSGFSSFMTQTAAAPQFYLKDSTAGEDDYQIYVEANAWELAGDTDDDLVYDKLHLISVSAANNRVGINGVPANFALEVTGSIGPEANGTRDLGSSSYRFDEVFAKRTYGFEDLQTATNTTDVVARHARNANVIVGRWDSSATLTGDHFNIASVTTGATGTYTVTPDVGIDTDSVCIGNVRTAGPYYVACIITDTTTITCKSYDAAGTLTDNPIGIICVGAPSSIP